MGLTAPPTLHLLLAGVVLLGAACSSATPRTTRGSGAPLRPRKEPEPAENVCCGGSSSPLAPSLEPLDPDPKLCCGKGWGLHCCLGGACCLGDRLVPRPPPPAAVLQDSAPWGWKDWAQWLNIIVVVLIVALVSAVMVCCCCRKNKMERNPLRFTDAHISSYGTVFGNRASAPHWTPSRWVDFSYVPASNTSYNAHPSPHYTPARTVRRISSSESDTGVHPSPIFSSSDEEYRLVAELKQKIVVPSS